MNAIILFLTKETSLSNLAVGELIECPICGIELIINEELQLEVLDLERTDEHYE